MSVTSELKKDLKSYVNVVVLNLTPDSLRVRINNLSPQDKKELLGLIAGSIVDTQGFETTDPLVRRRRPLTTMKKQLLGMKEIYFILLGTHVNTKLLYNAEFINNVYFGYEDQEKRNFIFNYNKYITPVFLRWNNEWNSKAACIIKRQIEEKTENDEYGILPPDLEKDIAEWM